MNYSVRRGFGNLQDAASFYREQGLLNPSFGEVEQSIENLQAAVELREARARLQ